MPGSLLGSAPKASFSTQPTISPVQNDLMNLFAELFKTGAPPAGVQSYGGTFSAPLQPIQQTSLSALEQTAMGGPPGQITKTPQQTAAQNQSFNTLSGALGYQAPKIDSTQAFQQGVVDPLTENFTSRVLPGLDAKFAGSAGGAYGSGRQTTNLNAAQDFGNTLTQQGAKFAYDTATANQAADLAANQQRLAALGVAPSITNEPTALDASIAQTNSGLTNDWISQLTQVLNAGAVPYNQAQTQVVGQYQDYQSQVQQQQNLLALLASAFGQPTVSTLGVGSGGSSGILPSLFTGLGTAAGAYFRSDERLKEDLEPIGDVDGIPLYRFKYKGEPGRHIGFMAQDVERRVPEAVVKDHRGYRLVNYGRVLESVLEAA